MCPTAGAFGEITEDAQTDKDQWIAGLCRGLRQSSAAACNSQPALAGAQEKESPSEAPRRRRVRARMRGAGSQPLPPRAFSKPPAGARRAARTLGDGCSTSSARPIAARPQAPALPSRPCPHQRAPALPPSPQHPCPCPRAARIPPSPPSARPSSESLPQLPLERQEAAAVGRGDADGHLQHRQVFLVLHLVPAPLAGRAPPPPPPPQTQPLQAPHRSALGHPPPRRAPRSRSCRRAWPARAAVRGPVPPPCAPSARSPPPRASSAPLRTGSGRSLEAALSEPCNTQVRTPRASVSPRGLTAYLQSIMTAKNLRAEKKMYMIAA